MSSKVLIAAAVALLLTSPSRGQLLSAPPRLAPLPERGGDTARWQANVPLLFQSAAGYVSVDEIAAASGFAMGGGVPVATGRTAGMQFIYFGETTARSIKFGLTKGPPTPAGGTTFEPGNAVTLGDAATCIKGTAWGLATLEQTFSALDLWVSVEGPGGGLYHAFNPSWGAGPGGFRISQPFALDTWSINPTTLDAEVRPVTTYLLAFEDGTGETDYSDLLIGFQFRAVAGHTDSAPEPSTTSTLAAATLLGLVGWRRGWLAQSQRSRRSRNSPGASSLR